MLFDDVVNPVDPVFAMLRDRPDLDRQRAELESLWERYRLYADDNFITELHLQCVARFWEMFLACSLLDVGFRLLPRTARPSAGPDICIAEVARRVWIEAVAPTPGSGPDAVPPLESNGGWVPEEQIVLRFRAVIEDKHRLYRRYVASGIIQEADAFLIAVNGGRIPNADIAFPDEVPCPIQAVLPIGAPSVTIDSATGAVVAQGFAHRPRILKQSGADISTRVFLDPDYAGISALLFSTVHPVRNTAGGVRALSLLHNPVAASGRMLPRAWLPGAVEWWVANDELFHHRVETGA